MKNSVIYKLPTSGGNESNSSSYESIDESLTNNNDLLPNGDDLLPNSNGSLVNNSNSSIDNDDLIPCEDASLLCSDYSLSQLGEESSSKISEGINSLKAPKMSLEDAQALSDAELLQLQKKSKNHTGPDFSEHMNCEFNYNKLTEILRARGYDTGWHKVSEGTAPVVKPDVIKLTKSESTTTRRSYVVPDDVAAKWKMFNKDIPCPSVTLAAAMERFMADYKAGKIKFEIGIDI